MVFLLLWQVLFVSPMWILYTCFCACIVYPSVVQSHKRPAIFRPVAIVDALCFAQCFSHVIAFFLCTFLLYKECSRGISLFAVSTRFYSFQRIFNCMEDEQYCATFVPFTEHLTVRVILHSAILIMPAISHAFG